MKKLLLILSLAAAGVSTAHAQFYSPSVTRGAVIGGIAGALIGGHNHDRWGEGAVIGAAAGALFGAAVDQSGPRGVVYAHGRPGVSSSYYPAPACEPVRVVYTAPARRVVYVNPVPRHVSRAPVVVVRGHRVEHRLQTVVYTHSRHHRRD